LTEDEKEHKSSDFIQRLKSKFAKNTIYKYLNESVNEKLIEMKPGSRNERFRPKYLITKQGLEQIQHAKIHSLIDSFDVKWLTPLRNLLVKINETQTYLEGFLNTNCITFIGDIPCTFPKSIEGMQSHIAFETSLHQRHQRDLEKFQDELDSTKDKASWARVDAKIKEEVGWSKGEYLKKLLKKAEKEEGIRKIMTVLGITDEMLEKMGYTSLEDSGPRVQKGAEGGGRS